MASPTSPGIVSEVTGGSGDLVTLFDGLKWGDGEVGTGVTLEYSFRTNDSHYSIDDYPLDLEGWTSEPWTEWSPFSDAQKDTIRAALAEWSKVADITFVEVPDSEAVAGDLRFGFSDDVETGVYAPAWAYTPDASAIAGDVWISNDMYVELADAEPGSYAYMVMVHEIGHALGFKHPHEFPVLAPGRDYIGYTVMSYRDYPSGPTGGGFESDLFTQGPMSLDIAAIQYLYGANTDDTADTSYSWDLDEPIYDTIWDAGGDHDIIFWGNQSSGATIDLRPNHWSLIGPERYDGHAADYGYTQKNLNIAAGVTIEDATGGSGSDKLIGNDAGNTLTGNQGADTLQGGNGGDTLRGGAGNDLLDGGFDADLIQGGTGTDTVSYAFYDGRIVLDLDGGTASFPANSLLADTLSSIENVVGAGGNDTIRGGASSANRLEGGAGADLILGRGGADDLRGGDGADRLYGGLGNDKLAGGAAGDQFVLDSALGASKDTIADFSRTQGDRIQLDNDIFLRLGASDTTRTLGANNFALGSAHDSNDFIVYKPSTGELFYDANGSGANGATVIAVLAGSGGSHPELFNWCFQIVG